MDARRLEEIANACVARSRDTDYGTDDPRVAAQIGIRELQAAIVAELGLLPRAER